jgi:hypothetical protein
VPAEQSHKTRIIQQHSAAFPSFAQHRDVFIVERQVNFLTMQGQRLANIVEPTYGGYLTNTVQVSTEEGAAGTASVTIFILNPNYVFLPMILDDS